MMANLSIIMSLIPKVLLDLRDKKASFSLFIETVFSINLVLMESTELSNEYFDGCISLPALGQFLQKCY